MNQNENSIRTKTLFTVLAYGILPLFLFTCGGQNLNAQKNLDNAPKVDKHNVYAGSINGYEYVDLGLPSGLKWATCNVGASSPEDYGDYFAWGEIKPKSSYVENNSETYGKDLVWLRGNGFIGHEGQLDIKHDAARQNWGGTWRMPTSNEIKELINNTTKEWTTRNGVRGFLLKSKKNGNSIFLPAASMRSGSSLSDPGELGLYWSSTPDMSNSSNAYDLWFSSSDFRSNGSDRYYGLSVRPVSDGRGKISDTINSQPSTDSKQEPKKNISASNYSINGHEYVDLGLPSGLKWATCNVGASQPEYYGSYFAWGETCKKSEYNADNSETYEKDLQWLRSNGYIDSRGNLTMAHDAARQNWGGTWRMPTLNEIKELENNTTTEWTILNGVYGLLLKSKNNGNTIFLPAAGYCFGHSLYDAGGCGYYWSTTPEESDYDYENEIAYSLYFIPSYFGSEGQLRSNGLPVRPVSE